MREIPEMSDFFQNHTLIKSDSLDPRDAFFGGRTENIATRYEITGAEKIRLGECVLFVCIENGHSHTPIFISAKGIGN